MNSSSSVPPHDHDGAAPGSAARPSLARTSLSSQATERTLSSHAAHANWERSTDIRGDLALGWGEDAGGDGTPPRAAAASASAGAGARNARDDAGDEWGWRLRDQAVPPVPAFFPLDPRSTRRVRLGGRREGAAAGEASVDAISLRVSQACQSLSIYGIWDNGSPSAHLSSMERVEMEIAIYLDDAASDAPPGVLVELQRRKGCSITFHKYRRCLLDAAEGKFDPEAFKARDGLEPPLGRDRANQPRASLKRPGLGRPSLGRPSPSTSGGRPGLARPTLSPPGSPSPGRPSPMGRPSLARPKLSPPGRPSPMGRPSLARPSPFRPPATSALDSPSMARPSLRSPSFSADNASVPIAGLKTEGETEDIVEKALKALNMAASLIKKDRVDARTLGMESLVLLTDPLRAGRDTAKIASRVVLLGSANDDADTGGDEDDVDALFDESAGLGIRETILEMIMTTDSAAEEKMASEEDGSFIEKEFTDTLFNLCLTVLSNALTVMGEEPARSPKNDQAGGEGSSVARAASSNNNQVEEDESSDTDDDLKPSPSDSSNRRRALTEPSVGPMGVSKRFIDDTNSTFGVDVLSSLIRILGQAKTNPHDAYHSARCLGVLFKGCGHTHKAHARKDLDAKCIIAMALEVGSRSHAKLEDASRLAMMALVTDDEGSVVEEDGGTTEMENDTTEIENDTTETENEITETGTERLGEETEVEQQELEELPLAMEQSITGDSDERY